MDVILSADIQKHVSQIPSPTRRIATTITVGGRTGWGIYGYNLALHAAAHGIQVVPVAPCDWNSLHPDQRKLLAGTEAVHQQFQEQIRAHLASGGAREIRFDGNVLHCLGDDLSAPRLDFSIQGKRNFGTVFLENSQLSPEAVASGKTLRKIIAGSNWNGDVLKNSGLTNISVVLQGIDPSLFFPSPRKERWPGRFVVFSGGKLEYRKGQDIVVAAFRQFAKQYPDALLIFAWHNGWANTMAEINRAGLVTGVPAIAPDITIDFTSWLRTNDLQNFVDLGQPCNWQTPAILREADVGLFPNRCEGGTNLVAMECMACGIPAILSANTGHLDLLAGNNCYPLKQQGSVLPTDSYPQVQGWGESSIQEIVENLEQVHQNREESRRRGLAAAETLRKLSWENQINKLLAEMD